MDEFTVDLIRKRQSKRRADQKRFGSAYVVGSIALDEIDWLLAERESILGFFGATEKDDGSLSINMPKYHAAHLCEKHQLDRARLKEVERCVLCLVDGAAQNQSNP